MLKGGVLSAAERKKCHLSRDAYFACLDRGNGEKSCLEEEKRFEENCPKTWVKYFCRRRDYKKYSERMDSEGFIPSSKET